MYELTEQELGLVSGGNTHWTPNGLKGNAIGGLGNFGNLLPQLLLPTVGPAARSQGSTTTTVYANTTNTVTIDVSESGSTVIIE